MSLFSGTSRIQDGAFDAIAVSHLEKYDSVQLVACISFYFAERHYEDSDYLGQ
jgi:hypothetical protein